MVEHLGPATAWLDYWIDRSPTGEVQVRTSSGFPLLDEAARSAVQTWRFNPATSDGKPVAEWYLVPIIFKLSN